MKVATGSILINNINTTSSTLQIADSLHVTITLIRVSVLLMSVHISYAHNVISFSLYPADYITISPFITHYLFYFQMTTNTAIKIVYSVDF